MRREMPDVPSRIVGVVPAAGRATRLQPIPGSKELLPVAARPVIEHLLERLERGGASEIRIVTRPEKSDLVEYAERRGLACVLGTPPTVAASLALGLEGLDAADIVLLGFPDTLWEPRDGFARLRETVEAGAEVALGIFSSEEPERSDVVVSAAVGPRVESIHVKEHDPPGRQIWGCFAARVGALVGVASAAELGQFLDRLAREGRVVGVDFGTPFVDVGTPEALAAVGGVAR
jgi:glucose-1-phosphate thymidylyltransferase